MVKWDITFYPSCPSPQNYKYLLDFIYYINEFNNNPLLSQNLTLGYHIYDSCGDVYKAQRSILQILSGLRDSVPNYSCAGKRNIVGFIGDLTSDTTIPIAHILSVLGYSQISYGATDPFLNDRATFPFFFLTVQSKAGQFIAITQLLKYFGWTWVGIITTNDVNGEGAHQLLQQYLSNEDICIDFTIKIRDDRDATEKILHKRIIQESSTSIVIFCGTININIALTLLEISDILSEKTFIFTSDWLYYSKVFNYAFRLFNGSLVFMQNREKYNKITHQFKLFLENMHPSKYPEDKLLESIWIHYHLCITENMSLSFLHKIVFSRSIKNCKGVKRLTDIGAFKEDFHTNNIIFAVDVLSKAGSKMHYLHNLYSKRNIERYGNVLDFKHKYQITNFYSRLKDYIAETSVGRYIPWAPLDRKLEISLDKIKWKTKNNKKKNPSIDRLKSFESKDFIVQSNDFYFDQSIIGFALNPSNTIFEFEGFKFEGRIRGFISPRYSTLEKYSENCIRCPDMEWPNENRKKCIEKMEEFLSYTNDVLSVFFSLVSFLLFVITLLILRIFFSHQETPIVRANNRSLSFLLLVSIKLSFLSVFLFLGRPVDITCMVRIIIFGITFSIAVSSVLAKTIMVCVAFKATKPGSSWRKWVGVKLSNSVVLFCSSIQIIICMTWLSISPPFQELDLHTYPGTIIIQCNEGSAIGFYSVIGYMGLLAAVSFVLAFLARTLPDSFNEAKYITFSMLLFCSVWITMIPAYLSTKGKNTVCVEIFAILTSSAGLLFCIFLPKCYIILYRPEMNTKSFLLGNKA
ncbi:hypothetical protein XELAEV_18004651mg [Xenopus laevis]|uniref:G-protein coupled receptors family 3 profile domain-containing protein n=1 Tax=Xenopus laevis TaxID=8355 RepID=A0A974GZQ6_XENLA|nr:hypothetical protein XELAEV_18004651mg [Xenopus laevis]